MVDAAEKEKAEKLAAAKKRVCAPILDSFLGSSCPAWLAILILYSIV